MRKPKSLNVIISAVLALTVAATPIATVRNGKVKPSAGKQTSYSTTQGEAVTVNSKNYDQYIDKNDKFYEPEEESITVVEDEIAYVNDAVVVYFDEDASQEDKDSVVASVNGQVVGNVDDMNQYEIKVERSDIYELNSVCDELMKNEAVEFATCSVVNEAVDESIPDDPWGGYADWSDTSLDSYYSSRNWWIKATDIDKAWDYKEYFNHIDIGIVDSGFDLNHEDLQDKIIFPTKYLEKTNLPSHHGAHVSGIIGATHNNKVGISGVVDDCTLICADWEADKEAGQHWISDLRILTGFNRVVKAGAKVVNFSVGSSGTIPNGTTNKYQFVKDVEAKFTSFYIAKLLQKGYDFICCQSAGNGTTMKDGTKYAVDASNNGIFSGITTRNAIKTVIGVSAQDIVDRIIIVASAKFNGYRTFEQSYFSNGGSQVSICAPGSSIYSTYYDEETGESTYAYLSGTSMAAPIVTGITSLVWSVNPEFTGAQVKQIVCDEANTKYVVEDSSDPDHLPEGTMRMVNAELAVLAAIRETYGEETTTEIETTVVLPEPETTTIISSEESSETSSEAESSTASTVQTKRIDGVFSKLFRK